MWLLVNFGGLFDVVLFEFRISLLMDLSFWELCVWIIDMVKENSYK